jgi:hypothetical protein
MRYAKETANYDASRICRMALVPPKAETALRFTPFCPAVASALAFGSGALPAHWLGNETFARENIAIRWLCIMFFIAFLGARVVSCS